MCIGSLFTVIQFEGSQSSEAMYCLLRYFKPNSTNSTSQNTSHMDTMNLKKNLPVSNHTEVSHSKHENEPLPPQANIYWISFVIFFYALPLTIIVILYGLMLKFLRGIHGQSVGKGKRRATRMILAVVLTYALCWFLMQLLFISNVILSQNPGHDFVTYMDILTVFANVFAYLNSV
jgi:hypothetical protein